MAQNHRLLQSIDLENAALFYRVMRETVEETNGQVHMLPQRKKSSQPTPAAPLNDAEDIPTGTAEAQTQRIPGNSALAFPGATQPLLVQHPDELTFDVYDSAMLTQVYIPHLVFGNLKDIDDIVQFDYMLGKSTTEMTTGVALMMEDRRWRVAAGQGDSFSCRDGTVPYGLARDQLLGRHGASAQLDVLKLLAQAYDEVDSDCYFQRLNNQ